LRRRLFVLGCVDGHRIDFPSPTHSLGAEDGLLPYTSIAHTLFGLRSGLPNSQIPKNTDEKKLLLARMKPGSHWIHWRHRDRWDQPSRCLTAHCRDEWVHPLEPRSASVRELAMLQTFPKRYVFRGPINSCNNSEYSFQYRQVGNAVPARMAKVLGRTLVGHLNWC
jgi:site-specific DNA-cytosine methylase